MDKRFIRRVLAVICAVMVMFTVPAASFTAQAATATATVSGTLGSSTNSNMIYLTTTTGTMEIKIDSDTTYIGSKMMLPGRSVDIGIYRGSDAYLHAATVTSSTAVTQVTVDTTKTYSIEGTIASGTTADKVIIATNDSGNIEAKVDSSSDFTGCTLIAIGRNVKCVLGRGSDAYLHIISMSDGANLAGSTETINGVSTTCCPGKVKSGSGSGTLYLSTTSGDMEIKIDSTSDISNCKLLLTDRAVNAYVYRGADAFMHAAKVTPVSSPVETSGVVKLTTVTGKIKSGSTYDKLYFSTSSGDMEIKVDSNTDMSTIGALYTGNTVNITIGNASDGYLHAMAITY